MLARLGLGAPTSGAVVRRWLLVACFVFGVLFNLYLHFDFYHRNTLWFYDATVLGLGWHTGSNCLPLKELCDRSRDCYADFDDTTGRHTRESGKICCASVMLSLLELVSGMLTAGGVMNQLSYGTLLGAVRERDGVLAWSDDADLFASGWSAAAWFHRHRTELYEQRGISVWHDRSCWRVCYNIHFPRAYALKREESAVHSNTDTTDWLALASTIERKLTAHSDGRPRASFVEPLATAQRIVPAAVASAAAPLTPLASATNARTESKLITSTKTMEVPEYASSTTYGWIEPAIRRLAARAVDDSRSQELTTPFNSKALYLDVYSLWRSRLGWYSRATSPHELAAAADETTPDDAASATGSGWTAYSDGECFFDGEWIDPSAPIAVRNVTTLSSPAQPVAVLSHVYGRDWRVPAIRGRGTEDDCGDNEFIKMRNTKSVVVLLSAISVLVLLGIGWCRARVFRCIQHTALCCCAVRIAGYDGGLVSSRAASSPAVDESELVSLTGNSGGGGGPSALMADKLS